ncbi:MAG: hypothetical protein PHP08_02440 [Candidatus Dojkabacteria bacterium]|nr:hypothetical protein [Candidatus Dojkabacteria bacterium]
MSTDGEGVLLLCYIDSDVKVACFNKKSEKFEVIDTVNFYKNNQITDLINTIQLISVDSISHKFSILKKECKWTHNLLDILDDTSVEDFVLSVDHANGEKYIDLGQYVNVKTFLIKSGEVDKNIEDIYKALSFISSGEYVPVYPVYRVDLDFLYSINPDLASSLETQSIYIANNLYENILFSIDKKDFYDKHNTISAELIINIINFHKLELFWDDYEEITKDKKEKVLYYDRLISENSGFSEEELFVIENYLPISDGFVLNYFVNMYYENDDDFLCNISMLTYYLNDNSNLFDKYKMVNILMYE